MDTNTKSDSELDTAGLFKRLDRLAMWAEMAVGSSPLDDDDWRDAIAFRWTSAGPFKAPRMSVVPDPALTPFAELCNVDRQIDIIRQNTRQFVLGYPANNVLLTGARGTGKSSLVRACLHAFAPDGLRLIEVSKDSLNELPDVFDRVRHRSERFLVFCDDLSFEPGETGYKGLKTVLDGSVTGHSSNVLIYATSNRRHLLAEDARDNESHSVSTNGELHPGDAIEEKISLSERFGIWITFYPFSQEHYLGVVNQRLGMLGLTPPQIEDARQCALQWALARGGRSGRIATQFAQDYAGRLACADGNNAPFGQPSSLMR